VTIAQFLTGLPGKRDVPDINKDEKPYIADREPAYDFLDPKRTSLWRDDRGCLHLTIQGDRSYLDVKVVRAFPHSVPHGYIGLLDAGRSDRTIGIVVDPTGMDTASQRTVEEALERHYFIPTITRVMSLKEEFGAVYIDVETDQGRRHFVARGIRDAAEELGDGGLLIPDVDGNRYRIADWRGLDARSRSLLESVV